MKSPTGWKKGRKFVAVLAVVAVMGLVFMGVNNGTMKGMNGQEISFFYDTSDDVSRIEPAAGDVYVSGSSSPSEEGAGVSEPYNFEEDDVLESPSHEVEEDGCGDHRNWVGKKVDERAVKATGQPYRILKPNSAVTQDYSAQRINVIVNDRDIVIEVKCG